MQDEELELEVEQPEPLEKTSPADAVLADLGLDDGAIDEPKAEPEAEPVKEAEPAPEQTKDITDKDLEPLNSKNPATNERFSKLTEGFKREQQRADELSKEVSKFKAPLDALSSLGFNNPQAAEDLIQFSDYRKIISSGDAEGFKNAIADQIRQFEAMHGKKISIEASGLDYFPELKQRVNDYEIDDQTALELARARLVQDRVNRNQQEQQVQQQQKYIEQQAVSESVGMVENMQSNWQRTDPDYQLILPYLQAQIEEIGREYPPQQWPQLIEFQYRAIKGALVQQNNVRPSVIPLRGNARLGGKASPNTPHEAVLQDLGIDWD